MSKPFIYVLDIDWTLRDPTHRAHLIPDWDTFYAEASKDPAIPSMLELTKALPQEKVYFYTGHPFREDSIQWLEKHGVVKPKLLQSRKRGVDVIKYKKELLESLLKDTEVLIFDDEPLVCDMAEKLGCRVLQVRHKDRTKAFKVYLADKKA